MNNIQKYQDSIIKIKLLLELSDIQFDVLICLLKEAEDRLYAEKILELCRTGK